MIGRYARASVAQAEAAIAVVQIAIKYIANSAYCISARGLFYANHRARMPITAALMIITVARAMLALNGRPLTTSSSAVEASGVR